MPTNVGTPHATSRLGSAIVIEVVALSTLVAVGGSDLFRPHGPKSNQLGAATPVIGVRPADPVRRLRDTMNGNPSPHDASH